MTEFEYCQRCRRPAPMSDDPATLLWTRYSSGLMCPGCEECCEDEYDAVTDLIDDAINTKAAFEAFCALDERLYGTDEERLRRLGLLPDDDEEAG